MILYAAVREVPEEKAVKIPCMIGAIIIRLAKGIGYS